MLSASTLLSLRRYTCQYCEKPLEDAHTYPLIQPDQLISQTSEMGPHHLECARAQVEELLKRKAVTLEDKPQIIAFWTVKASPSSSSARIIRLNDHDPDSATLHLFSPDSIRFDHTVCSRPFPRSTDRHLVTRPAGYEEIYLWMEPALRAATVNGTEEQIDEITHQIARLLKHLPPRPKTDTPATHTP